MELRADWPTDSMDGLIWSLLFHLIAFLFICKSLIERMRALTVCVHNVYVCVHVCLCLYQGLNQWLAVFTHTQKKTLIHIHPWLFICFQHASLCRHRSTHFAAAHSLASACDRCSCYTSTPKFSSVFLFLTKPKTSAIGLLFENCSLMNKILSCPPSPFSPFPPLFPGLFLTVWDTTLCECSKTQRYPHPDFVMCMANWLFWMVLKLNVLTGSCMYGNADL